MTLVLTRNDLRKPKQPARQCFECFTAGLTVDLSRRYCRDCQAK